MQDRPHLRLLYRAGAAGLRAYARGRFRVRVLGSRFQLQPCGIVVSTHRSDADVPVLVAALYRQAHGRGGRRDRELHFAVRDDLFLRGFFGGYPPGLPDWVRRLLFPLGIGGILSHRLPCLPIRSATRMRLVELLADHPEAPLDELLTPELGRPFHAVGLRPDARAAEAVHGRFARLLWREIEPEDAGGPLAEESWGRRAAAALADFRSLCDVVRGGDTLLLFPEGRPSPDGSVGPLRPGIDALLRRAQPSSLRAVALAYDPLVDRRPYAYVGVGEAVEPSLDDQGVLALLRRTMPLTPAQLVATGGGAVEIEASLAEGRPVAPELLDARTRDERLAAAGAAAAGRDLGQLALEYRSARA